MKEILKKNKDARIWNALENLGVEDGEDDGEPWEDTRGLERYAAYATEKGTSNNR